MHGYEIRVIGEANSELTIYQAAHRSLAQAIGAGRKLAEGQPFEVWRGPDCIFTSNQSTPSGPREHNGKWTGGAHRP